MGLNIENLLERTKRILLFHANRIEPMPPEIVEYFVEGLNVEEAIEKFNSLRGRQDHDIDYIRGKYVILQHICERKRIRIPSRYIN